MFTRRNAFAHGGTFDNPDLLWYAKGVALMKKRPLSDKTSWWFYGAIHGFDERLWKLVGLPTSPRPDQDDVDKFWNQCQHGSWYFLPWHRGYLVAFERLVREAIVAQGGPADWALPYWNYFLPDQNVLPPAFAAPTLPNSAEANPLYVPQRYGPFGDGNVYVLLEQGGAKVVDEDALGEPDFTDDRTSGNPAFGGYRTGFAHGSGPHGKLEHQPHDLVHGLVGGAVRNTDPDTSAQFPESPGWMAKPATAGNDPIFWLHHANVDRLWEVWRRSSAAHADPAEPLWVGGPAYIGEDPFSMPLAGGETYDYTPGDVTDLDALGYGYDDTAAPERAPSLPARAMFVRRRIAPKPTDAFLASTEETVTTPGTAELLGASPGRVPLVGSGATATVTVDAAVRDRLSGSLDALRAPADAGDRAAAVVSTAPDRVFLHLENVRGLSDATVFQVFVGLPADPDLARHPQNLAGSVALFGVHAATEKDGGHAGDGLSFVLEITHIVDNLHLAGHLGASDLQVRLVPVRPVPEEAKVSVGRISIFRRAG